MTNSLDEIHIQAAVREDYFRWLCELVGAITEAETTSYRGLAYALFEMDYIWLVPHDDNRGADGVALREEYFDLEHFTKTDHKLERLALSGPCKILEMMVGLARRCEDDIMYDPKKGDRTSVWFFHMIKNLGLDHYCDANFDCHSQKEIADIVNLAINRGYSESGVGGFFPLKQASQDQRTVELWYQLMSWLNENYF